MIGALMALVDTKMCHIYLNAKIETAMKEIS
jgi:hypothetical protein